MDVELKYVSPWNKFKPHIPQQEFLSLPTIGDTVSKIHFISGRSGGKTAAAVMLVFRTCIEEPGTMGLVIAPTYKMLQRSFVREWEQMIPANLYRYNRGDQTITMVNGSLFFLETRSINNPSKGKDVNRGNNLNWIVDDEAALGFDHEAFANTLLCLRRPGKHRFYAFTTTPRINEYYDIAHEESHKVVYSTSYDNPWNPNGFIEDAAKAMSDAQREREIDGKWVKTEGLCWKSWSWDPWPNGNVYEYRFRPDLPWYLFLDLGSATGAFVAAQLVSTHGMGRGVQSDHIWVATHELLPSDDGSASRAFQRLRGLIGTPHMVIGGADLTTRASTDAKTAIYFARQIFGSNIAVRPITGWHADKQIQYDCLSKAISDSANGRKLCIASDFKSLGQGSSKTKRGIREMMRQDVWPDNAGKSRSNFFNKDGRLEHIRDALLYGAVGIMEPPRMAPDERLAG